MRFLSEEEALAWYPSHTLPTPNAPTPNVHRLDFFFKDVSATDFLWLGWRLADVLGPWDECMLWVTQSEIWAANLHLYYRLRQSYGDMRLLREAPCHLFLAFEDADLRTFLSVGLLNGWEMHLVTTHDYAQVFVSHDGWAAVTANQTSQLDVLKAALAAEPVPFTVSGPTPEPAAGPNEPNE